MEATDAHAWLKHALDHAGHLLPDQGPMAIFVHHNTLHGLQHLPFHDAVTEGASHTGARAYPPESFFHQALANGRITHRDLEEALVAGDAPVALGLTERSLRLALLERPLAVDDVAGLRHRLSTGAFVPDAARWAACERRLAGRPPAVAPAPTPRRHRDVLVALGADDPDVAVHRELMRLSAAFLDQGQALTPMPGRSAGFLRAVLALYATGGGLPRGCGGLSAELGALASASAEAIVAQRLADLGVTEDREAYVLATLLALPGWAGMFARLERRPEEAHHDPHAKLVDFLAVRLVLERYVLAAACDEAGLPLAWSALRAAYPAPAAPDRLADVALLYGLASAAQVPPEAVDALDPEELARLFAAVDAFPQKARQRVLLEAYEGRYRRQVLDALAAHRAEGLSHAISGRAKAGFAFCIDEREESTRRAVEEQDPQFETWGVAGFFGVAVDYRGVDDHAPGAYCPAVVTPAHEVHEHAMDEHVEQLASRQRIRSVWKRFQRRLEADTRALFGGALQSVALAAVSGTSLVSDVVAPRVMSDVQQRFTDVLVPRPLTRLGSTRAPDGPVSERGKPLGFTTQEAIDRVTATLTNLGLVRNMPPIVAIIGHGSTSLNNPHESAHDCGACGGRRGGANARLFAELANRPEVREGVRARGVSIDEDTWFVGALHDTASDEVVWYDTDKIPAASQPHFAVAYLALENARRENARERARRFDDAPLGISPEAALRHVQWRATTLAQPRPEYGHCTNAVAVVGRRVLTRGLFLDRRPFLISYDPAVDPQKTVLERILAAVGPVGAGINLEYWFSSVDNEVYGCGTKLPHNVTGLVGVMNGHQSDLRTGLPLQMVELHEPMRLLLIVEATPETLLAIAGRQAEVRELVVNEWVQLVSVDPTDGRMQRFHNGGFVPYVPEPVQLPHVEHSPLWFARSREFLPPAVIRTPPRGDAVAR